VSNRVAIGVGAAALFLGALIAALVPVHANGISCGSAFGGGDQQSAVVAQYGDDLSQVMTGLDSGSTDYAGDCGDRRGTQAVIVIPLLVIAALAGGYVALTGPKAGEKAQTPRAV
jgi:hypothetical protein